MIKSAKVLIAEDDDSIARLYQTYLEAHSFTIQRAQDGDEALEQIQSFKPDVLLLDIMMPEKNGFDVLEELKSSNNKLPVIVFTALSSEDEKKKALDYGVKAYFVKSQVIMSDILDKINEIVQ